ncbi:MAG: transcription termination/antitermination protein NusG, partial [Acidimicrobiales bacterium]
MTNQTDDLNIAEETTDGVADQVDTDVAAPADGAGDDVAETGAVEAEDAAPEPAESDDDAAPADSTTEDTDSDDTASDDTASDDSDSDDAASDVVADDTTEAPEAEQDVAAEGETDDEAVAEGDEASDEEDEAPPPKRESPYDRPGRWYVLHTQSGYENKVKSNLEARTQSMNMEERIFEIVIPLEDVVEFKNGKKVVVQKKVFPGYLLVRMRLDDDSWFVVRNTPGVTGFVGAGNTPSPLPRRDVESFLAVKVEGDEPNRKGRPRLEYGMGETVRVKEGPFADFQGEIVEINEDQLKLKVLVNIFGRET